MSKIPSGWDVFQGGPPPNDPDDPGPVDTTGGASVDSEIRCTDLGNADIFLANHGEDIRYCYDRGAWLAWVGDHWSWSDAQRQIERRSAETVRRELSRVVIDDAPKKIVQWARSSCSSSKRYAMVESAKHVVPVSIADLDANHLLTNTPSGSVDLKAGVVLNHDRADLCTHLAGAKFSSRARAPRWERFIREITRGSEALSSYLQRAVGYSITGLTVEQCLFVCIGTGANGKGVFLRAISLAIGTYARAISAELLLAGKGLHNKRPELAELVGVRLATANEPSGNSEMDESLIKVLTGGDTIVGERKYEQPFTFRPQAKIWLACNKAPRFQSGGFSMDRRLRVIPFRQTFAGADRDDTLDATLESEIDGILRWSVDGAQLWAKDGLGTCPEVDEATEEFRGEANPISRWSFERLHDAPSTSRVSIPDAYADYKSWTEEAGEKPLGQSRFRDLIRSQGHEMVSISRRVHVVGKRVGDVGVEADEYEERDLFSGQD